MHQVVKEDIAELEQMRDEYMIKNRDQVRTNYKVLMNVCTEIYFF